tara:strand:- start:22 stop:492 length:471 start_codon:yes stop_codon:yes gene_type:complete
MKGNKPTALLHAPRTARKDVSTPGTSRNNTTRNKSAFTSPNTKSSSAFPSNKSKGSSTPDNSDHDHSPSPKTSPKTPINGAKVKKKRRSVRKWTIEEDNQMRGLVKRFGTRKWSTIGGFLEGRNGKQCRERWHNQLDPSIKKSAWTDSEEVRKYFF